MTRHTNPSHGTQFSGPIIHFVRHAEREHKPNDGSPNAYDHISGPILTHNGRKHCIRRNDFLSPQAKYITHVLTSPLSRGLETALLTMKVVTNRGIKVWAIPELQSISPFPAGIGIDLKYLRSRYEVSDEGEEVAARRKHKSKKGTKVKVANIDDFKGKLDVGYMSGDWNDVQRNVSTFAITMQNPEIREVLSNH